MNLEYGSLYRACARQHVVGNCSRRRYVVIKHDDKLKPHERTEHAVRVGVGEQRVRRVHDERANPVGIACLHRLEHEIRARRRHVAHGQTTSELLGLLAYEVVTRETLQWCNAFVQAERALLGCQRIAHLELDFTYEIARFVENERSSAIDIASDSTQAADCTMRRSDRLAYLVDTADIFYRDEKVGTLPRDEWGYTETAGDYIRIENKEGLKNWYNKSFIKSDAPDSFSREYRRDDDTGAMLHLGSNQEAFVPGCTLVPEEVRQSIRISPDMKILDLQGNVLGDLSAYQDASLDVDSGFIVVTNKKGKQGVVGRTGIDLIPCKYDHVEGMDCLNLSGVIYAERDGKSGWVHVEDGTETSFKFPADYAMRTSNFILIDDGQDVGYILISADGGQLDRHFRDVTASSVPRAAGNKIAMVEEMDGTCRIIGQYGEEILPGVTFGSMYNATISYDGTVVTTRDMNTNQFIVYLIDYSPY